MGVNREAECWQAPDGTWSLGFWWFEFTSDPGNDGTDHEWDVEYSDDRFWFLTTGHDTPSAAMKVYRRDHPNPGFDLCDKRPDESQNPAAEVAVTHWKKVAAAFKARYGHDVEAYDHP
jgi:hypothetical protein